MRQDAGSLVAKASSAEDVFDAMAARLPPQHRRSSLSSELDCSSADQLKRQLAQAEPIIVGYVNSWLRPWDRYSNFFVVWTYGSFAALLVGMFVGGVLGLVGDDGVSMLVLLALSILAGLGLAIRYAVKLPPMAERSITLILGPTRELVHACSMRNDEPVDVLVRAPLSELVVELAWGQYGDHAPSFVSTLLRGNPPSRAGTEMVPALCLARVDCSHSHVPDEIVRKAKELAGVLGAQYVGIAPWSDDT
jgi:hypothetical protein